MTTSTEKVPVLERLFHTRAEYYARIYEALEDGTMPGYSLKRLTCSYYEEDPNGEVIRCVAGLLCPEGSLPPDQDMLAMHILNKPYFRKLLPEGMSLSELDHLQCCHDSMAHCYFVSGTWQENLPTIRKEFQEVEHRYNMILEAQKEDALKQTRE